MEITVTGANALTYPVLNIWNWAVAVYLFLVGTAAGLLVMITVAFLRNRNASTGQRNDIQKAAGFAPLLLLLGVLTILLELEGRRNFYWLFLSFSPSSVMFWGGWGLWLTFISAIFFALSLMTEDVRERYKFNRLKGLSLRLSALSRILAGICCILGILIGLYTGVSLLFPVRPLWDSTAAPLLFLLSSMTTGAALFLILSRDKPTRLFFARALAWMIGAEIAAIPLYYVGQLTSSPAKREAMLPFLSFTNYFMISFVLVGICVPLALVLSFLQVNEKRGEISGASIPRMRLGAYLVLAGGLVLRIGWVYLGQMARLP